MKKPKSVVKGAPSGLVISLLVHGAAFALAGLLVVFTVNQKDEKKFVPPKPVERPKMKLKKPKVKVKKNAKPKSSSRIVTQVKRANMPDIQLPEMSGMGEGLAGGGMGDGFDLTPDLEALTIFGGGQTIGNDFVGTLYDFKRTRQGGVTGLDRDSFLVELGRFTRGGWKASRLSKYYQAPKKLYTTNFMIPTISSDIAPTAFGEPDMIGYAWAAYYKGDIVHPEGGRFRFWAQGDDIMIVRLEGEVVVDGSVSDNGSGDSFREILTGFAHLTADSMKYFMGERVAAVGPWFTLEPGVPQKMEVLLGEVPGGSFSAMLTIQQEGVEYPTNPQGGPLLPMFKTAVPSHDVLDSIYEHLVLGEACLTNGPVFCDYGVGASEPISGKESEPSLLEPAQELEAEAPSSLRLWTNRNGKNFEASFVTLMGDDVVLKSVKNKTVKVSRSALSPEDIEYIQLSNPPEFKIDFRALSKQRQIASRTGASSVPTVLQWQFGAKVKQAGVGAYNHELTIEYYAIGQQYLDRSKYILLDRGQDRFTPSAANSLSHSFLNDRVVELMRYVVAEQTQGRKKAGYLIVMKDKRGKIIQHQASNEWLWDNLSNLEKLPVGAFMDKACARVFPTGPKATKY